MISLSVQIACVQLQIAGLNERLRVVSENGRWPASDIDLKRIRIEELEAVLRTLRWLEANEAVVRQRLA